MQQMLGERVPGESEAWGAESMLESRYILGHRVDATSYRHASRLIVDWAQQQRSAYVCVASVNNIMQAHDDAEFARISNEADLITPDGMPLVWGLRRLGVRDATRVYGPILTPTICAWAERNHVPVGFFGGTDEVLRSLRRVAAQRWPGLDIAYELSPPFRPLTENEDAQVVAEINASGARILFVGLGCPKQELWMAAHVGSLTCVQVGVGAAFDFLAGKKRQAPRFIQSSGFEWVFRLVTEPRRLWKRYLRHNPRFAVLFARQLLRAR